MWGHQGLGGTLDTNITKLRLHGSAYTAHSNICKRHTRQNICRRASIKCGLRRVRHHPASKCLCCAQLGYMRVVILHIQGSSASAKPAPAVAEPPSTGSLSNSSVSVSKAEPAAGDVLIELRNVYKSFGNKPILRGANIQIRRGEAVGIIGGSGTGKSTTLRIMAGLLMPDVVSCSFASCTASCQAVTLHMSGFYTSVFCT